MHNPFNLRRSVIAAAGAALVLAGAAGANAAGGPRPGTPDAVSATAGVALVNPAMTPGGELQFIAVAPCRIVDTRKVGGAISTGSRVFDATLATYAAQGGKAGTCAIPDVATAVQLNLGAISQNGKTSDVKGWATGTTEPTASLVNYNPSGPVANMVTMPLNATGRFTLKTPGSAHVFADVTGYYVKPLYATIDALDVAAPVVYKGVASGLVDVDTFKENDVAVPGLYVLTFDRNVTHCGPTATDFAFDDAHVIAVDSTFSGDSSVVVHVMDSAGEPAGTIFHVSLTC